MRSKGAVPGTFKSRPFEPVEVPLSAEERAYMDALRGGPGVRFRRYRLGQCTVFVDQEPAGPGGRLLWHLSISHPRRYPTWDEIKVARYRLTPADVTMAMLLPAPEQYVNVPEQDNVFHLWETEDPRADAEV